MDPKSSAAERLASLQNAINMGTAPQYTPAGTPLAGAVPDDHTVTYTPPTLARAPFITSGPAIAAPTAAPTPAPTPAPSPTPTLQPQSSVAPQQPAYAYVPPMSQPLSRTIPQPTPQKTLSVSSSAFMPSQSPTPAASPSIMTVPAYGAAPQPQPTPQHRTTSYIVSIIATIFVVITLILTGLLYLYGATLLKTTQPTTAAETPTAPSNGFQVTESSVFEPNFDQEQSAGGQVNTDPAQMFDDSSLPPVQ